MERKIDRPKLAETTQGRNDPGRKNPGPKRLRTETTLGRNDPERLYQRINFQGNRCSSFRDIMLTKLNR